MENKEQFSTYKLIIRRVPAFTGAALQTNILVNDTLKSQVGNNGEKEFILPRKITPIKLYNKVPLSFGNINKEMIIDPLQNSVVVVNVKYKMNWIAVLPPLCFIMPPSSIRTEIQYML